MATGQNPQCTPNFQPSSAIKALNNHKHEKPTKIQKRTQTRKTPPKIEKPTNQKDLLTFKQNFPPFAASASARTERRPPPRAPRFGSPWPCEEEAEAAKRSREARRSERRSGGVEEGCGADGVGVGFLCFFILFLWY